MVSRWAAHSNHSCTIIQTKMKQLPAINTNQAAQSRKVMARKKTKQTALVKIIQTK